MGDWNRATVLRLTMEGNIALRPLQTTDSSDLHRWFNDQKVLENLGAMHIFFCVSLEEEERVVREKIEKEDESNFIIVDGEENRSIGWCALTNIDSRNESTEIQVIIGEEEYRERGYRRETVRLMLDRAFEVMNMHRVFLRVAEYNHTAISCYRACGFRVEGELRHDHFHGGEYRNSLLMSILREEHGGQYHAER